MVVDAIIKNGKLVVPRIGVLDAGVAIENGKVVAIAKDSLLPKADEEIDAHGNYLLPGIIDPHTHLGNYLPFEEECYTETRSAAGGGVTTFFGCVKLSRLPQPLSSSKTFSGVFDDVRKIVESKAVVDMAIYPMMLTPSLIDDIHECMKLGVSSFKFQQTYKGKEAKELGYPDPLDDGEIYRGFEEIAKHGDRGLAQWHAENTEVINHFKKKLLEEGRTDLAAWTDSRPDFNEDEATHKVCVFAKRTGCRLYIVHVDTEPSLERIVQARREGATVYAETCPHYLTLSKNESFGVLGKVNPPLREKETMALLWQGVADGTIDCIGTDHVPSKKSVKVGKGDIWSALLGFPGVETMLPVMLSEGVNKGRISLNRLVEVCSYNTARIFNLYPRKGTIQVGSDADIIIVDLHRKVKVSPDVLHSAADFTLYDGWTLEGWPIFTMVRGNVVMEDGQVTGKPGTGQYLPR
jgi:dihydropyrimidinase